ncbi:hypothetical protein F2Q70_00040975 [Brassica cretica]|uniref:Uncharacterized protein n=1 Tax=Brassica cretica TaxID=69181 RepID=A0A8S9K5K5_BRACR|nr:hypothetical protein F2Q70_00040975 [Brassica cretica]KAF2618960.1 hypothetical protein F2Q68_00041614 [Brassica cretica]
MKKIEPPTMAEPLYHSRGSQGQAHQNTITFPIALFLSLSRRLRRITHPRFCRRQRDRRHRPRRAVTVARRRPTMSLQGHRIRGRLHLLHLPFPPRRHIL